MRQMISWWLLIAAVVALSACNPVKSMQSRQRVDKLDAVVDTYRKLIRWGYFDQAAQYVKARDGSALEADAEELARFKVTGYAVADRWLADTGVEARVLARIDFYEVESGVARSMKDEQLWWYDEADERWYLGSSLPQFAAAM